MGTANSAAPHVILVMCDDLGWGDLRCFNPDSRIATPNLNALAADGLKFTRFYAASPVCSPTRGSCLTGRHPSRYGIPFANTGHLLRQEITLPELLRTAGYATGHFGKWHLGTLTTEIEDANRGGPEHAEHFAPPAVHGYDVCFVTESKVPTYDPMIKPKGAGGTAWDWQENRGETVPYGTRYWNERGEAITENLEGDDSARIMDRTVDFIRQSTANDRPFFAAVWFHAPHLPVVAGPEDVEAYAAFDKHARNYYGCVAAVDRQMGRLVRVLEELNARDETLLWFCSDNGPEGNASDPGSAANLRGRKRSLHEGGVRVPGILSWPARIKTGRVTDVPAVTSDFLPTIADALRIAAPSDRPLDGISLLPLIEGTTDSVEREIGFQSRSQVAWTTNRYKLYSDDGGATWQLYDLVDDPPESTDLADEHPEQVEAMRKSVGAWLASCRRSFEGADYVAASLP